MSRLDDIPRESWDLLLRSDDNPFLRWDFLAGLETTGCVAPDRGWHPCHLTAWDSEGLLAAAPAYVKTDGMGDFSRDWGFVDLLRHLGGHLYPKLIVGVPFSPVTGRRILVRPGNSVELCCVALMKLAQEIARQNELGAIQVLYHHPEERASFEAAGLAPRALVQYHWYNHDYQTSDDWLMRLKSKRRTQARRERREPRLQGLRLRTVRGDEIASNPRHWAEVAHGLYRTTCEKYMWGGAYLNRSFYGHLFESLSDHVELVLAERHGRPIAGAVNIACDTHLYGRYWGCYEEHRFLHFNVCLYHSIDECIERKIRVFEGGAGGEHKISRGFEPTIVHCAHWFAQEGVHQIIGRALAADTLRREREVDRWLDGEGLARL